VTLEDGTGCGCGFVQGRSRARTDRAPFHSVRRTRIGELAEGCGEATRGNWTAADGYVSTYTESEAGGGARGGRAYPIIGGRVAVY